MLEVRDSVVCSWDVSGLDRRAESLAGVVMAMMGGGDGGGDGGESREVEVEVDTRWNATRRTIYAR